MTTFTLPPPVRHDHIDQRLSEIGPNDIDRALEEMQRLAMAPSSYAKFNRDWSAALYTARMILRDRPSYALVDSRYAVLCDEYDAWNKSHGLKLGSADEHIFDESLTEPQREWVRDFSRRWEAVRDTGMFIVVAQRSDYGPCFVGPFADQDTALKWAAVKWPEDSLIVYEVHELDTPVYPNGRG